MSDTIKPPKDNPNAAWTPKVQDRLQEQVNALRMALDTEMSAANLYAKQVAHWIEKHDALRERIKVLEDALSLAYGHLWCINDEPGTPSPIYPAMQAAYEARKILRDLLTTEQRGNGIDAARAALGEP